MQLGTSVSRASGVSFHLHFTALGCQSEYDTTTLVNSSSLKFAILSSQASADKLSLEMEEFGFPPVFPSENGGESENGVENDNEEEIADPTKRAKKVGMFSSDFS